MHRAYVSRVSTKLTFPLITPALQKAMFLVHAHIMFNFVHFSFPEKVPPHTTQVMGRDVTIHTRIIRYIISLKNGSGNQHLLLI